ncbi:MAG: gamma-glutamyltransferase [Cloacibacterium sp.]|nr:gamma-glutamyltransferase [Cloacibacterium sp.]
MKKILFLSLIVSVQSFAQFTDYTIVKEIKVKNKGVVVSAHPLASEVGAKILKEGGNAFDASIAVQYALAVVYPQAGNIGGGGFLLATTSDGNKISIDYRETAPSKATRDMYLDKKGNAQTELSQRGRLAAGVPGTVAGLFSSHRYAKLPMEKLIQPSIELAEKGFAITEQEAHNLNQLQAEFRKYNSHRTAFEKDTPWKEGDILIQKELAETLKRIQKYGEKGFYEGKTAEYIVAEMERGKGIISLEDLRNYKSVDRKPLVFNYKGREIVSMSLPSSGGILLAQMLKMSELGGLGTKTHNSKEAVQIMIEAERRAYADRAEYMGDPDFIKDKTSMLISDEYLRNRWKSYSPYLATPSKEVGKIIQPNKQSEQTTHLSIWDKFGNAVSVTTTLNDSYGAKTVVAGAGFLLNNDMDDFSIKPGVPNMYGAVGGEANAISPNKRMLSSMTPTIVTEKGKPYIIIGTPGGTTIPTSVFQAIVGIVDFKLTPSMAINAPKFHHQWLPEVVFTEKNFPKDTEEALEKMNYTIKKRGNIGRTEIIVIDENGNINAVADSRGDDSVAAE